MSKRYTKSHEWIDPETGRVGISDHAQKELGELVYVELPPVGTVLKEGDEAAVVESTKAATDLYAPVSGKVVEINEALRKTPALINHSAEQQGWLYKLKITDPKEAEALMNHKEYEELF